MYHHFMKKREEKGLNIPRAELYLPALLEVNIWRARFWERCLAAMGRGKGDRPGCALWGTKCSHV